MRRFSLLVATIVGTIACSTLALAAGLHDMSGRVIAVQNAPVLVQSCDMKDANFGVVAQNNTTLRLASFSVRFQTFDANGKIISSGVFKYDLPLASGDSDKGSQYNNGTMMSPVDNVAMTCRIASATFEGEKKPWRYGDVFPKSKLLPLSSPTPGGQQ